MQKCLFAGTFDPFTIGHEAVVSRALELFDEVVVAVMVNPNKTCFFSEEERLSFLKAQYEKDPRVTVVAERGLVIDVMNRFNIRHYVRGVRNGSDFDYETQNYYASKSLGGDVCAVYFPAEQEMLAVSSTAVRLAMQNGKPYEAFLPQKTLPLVRTALSKK
jgi:pantetheine-phosphate adenylyltransferase